MALRHDDPTDTTATARRSWHEVGDPLDDPLGMLTPSDDLPEAGDVNDESLLHDASVTSGALDASDVLVAMAGDFETGNNVGSHLCTVRVKDPAVVDQAALRECVSEWVSAVNEPAKVISRGNLVEPIHSSVELDGSLIVQTRSAHRSTALKNAVANRLIQSGRASGLARSTVNAALTVRLSTAPPVRLSTAPPVPAYPLLSSAPPPHEEHQMLMNHPPMQLLMGPAPPAPAQLHAVSPLEAPPAPPLAPLAAPPAPPLAPTSCLTIILWGECCHNGGCGGMLNHLPCHCHAMPWKKNLSMLKAGLAEPVILNVYGLVFSSCAANREAIKSFWDKASNNSKLEVENASRGDLAGSISGAFENYKQNVSYYGRSVRCDITVVLRADVGFRTTEDQTPATTHRHEHYVDTQLTPQDVAPLQTSIRR